LFLQYGELCCQHLQTQACIRRYARIAFIRDDGKELIDSPPANRRDFFLRSF
jgi:hypothetical protein